MWKWLIAAGVAVFLLCAGGIAFGAYRIYDRVSASGEVDNETAAANAKSCTGKSYVGQASDRDRCADGTNTAEVNGLKITLGPLKTISGTVLGGGAGPVEKRSCTAVTVVNTGTESAVVSAYAFTLQNKAGEQFDPALTPSGAKELSTVTLAAGGTSNGTVCFEPAEADAADVVIWETMLRNEQRGVWFADALK